MHFVTTVINLVSQINTSTKLTIERIIVHSKKLSLSMIGLYEYVCFYCLSVTETIAVGFGGFLILSTSYFLLMSIVHLTFLSGNLAPSYFIGIFQAHIILRLVLGNYTMFGYNFLLFYSF